ncbi:DUF6485 family protein [Clostridioides mangenotii]|uniref:DUF6485 family protein n=1 Tax=Metaclostridioides mangenotii TaxID=1540 RepID=UPI002149CEE7|nr:DUF6485 family protein [Clostridioides mangenotii]MCR1953625.1 DUF6485 family protein [Clostridioides mangenotii]
MNDFCNCINKSCPLHPSNHDKGCTLCIQNNLTLREIPNCFFNLVTEDTDPVELSSLDGFANEVMKQKQNVLCEKILP